MEGRAGRVNDYFAIGVSTPPCSFLPEWQVRTGAWTVGEVGSEGLSRVDNFKDEQIERSTGVERIGLRRVGGAALAQSAGYKCIAAGRRASLKYSSPISKGPRSLGSPRLGGVRTYISHDCGSQALRVARRQIVLEHTASLEG